MRILDASGYPGHPVDRFGSVGFHVGPAGGSVHVVVVRLEPGGRIGRHPAVVDQALVPIVGDALVSGEEGTSYWLAPGEAVLWRKGEEHETSTRSGLTALILEGDELFAALPRSLGSERRL